MAVDHTETTATVFEAIGAFNIAYAELNYLIGELERKGGVEMSDKVRCVGIKLRDQIDKIKTIEIKRLKSMDKENYL